MFAHVVRFREGQYAIRRITLDGIGYLNLNPNSYKSYEWHSHTFRHNATLFSSVSAAREAYRLHKMNLKPSFVSFLRW